MEYGGKLRISTEKSPITSVMDLGRLLLEAAKDGNTKKVYELMAKGAPFTTDVVGIQIINTQFLLITFFFFSAWNDSFTSCCKAQSFRNMSCSASRWNDKRCSYKS